MRFNLPLFPEPASTLASRVDALYFFLLAVSVCFSLLIFVAVIYFAIKYRHKPDEIRAPQIVADNLALEITWTAVPLALTMVMFFWGASVYFSMSRAPENALEIFVV